MTHSSPQIPLAQGVSSTCSMTYAPHTCGHQSKTANGHFSYLPWVSAPAPRMAILYMRGLSQLPF